MLAFKIGSDSRSFLPKRRNVKMCVCVSWWNFPGAKWLPLLCRKLNRDVEGCWRDRIWGAKDDDDDVGEKAINLKTLDYCHEGRFRIAEAFNFASTCFLAWIRSEFRWSFFSRYFFLVLCFGKVWWWFLIVSACVWFGANKKLILFCFVGWSQPISSP